MAVNVEMFKKIRDQIKRDPKAFQMADWEASLAEDVAAFADDFDVEFYDANRGGWDTAPASECGTARCVAGWAIYFEAESRGLNLSLPLGQLKSQIAEQEGFVYGATFEELGERILGLDGRTSLFYKDEEEAYEIVNEYAEGLRS